MKTLSKVAWVLVIFMLCLSWNTPALAKLVRVGIGNGSRTVAIAFTPTAGGYDVYAGGVKIAQSDVSTPLTFRVEKGFVSVQQGTQAIGTFPKVKLVATGSGSIFRFKLLEPQGASQSYDDNMEVSIIRGYLRAVNVVDIEKYVAGVIEAEIGNNTSPEFLKAKAVICRTYALSHSRRHAIEGFELCDQVHCQVYKGRIRTNMAIRPAVEATEGITLIDSANQYITAAFSANCGGQTMNSEDVWSESLPYLRSVVDTFCLRQPGANWEKTFALGDWTRYLANALEPPPDGVYCDSMLCYDPSEREITFSYGNHVCPLKKIRSDWGLRSTWFRIETDCNKVLLRGRGYGHGVGFCQEGAMRMAELDYTYEAIINFYYRDVRLITSEALGFIKDP